MYNCIVINIDELWLKGKNRHLYFKVINRHVREVAKRFHNHSFTCRKENQRLVLKSDVNFCDDVISYLIDIPGINSIVPSIQLPLDIDKIFEIAVLELKERVKSFSTFKVKTKRSNKRFPVTSIEVSRQLGTHILSCFENLSVDIKNADIILDVKILDEFAYVSSQKLEGVGGFPVGVHGNVLTLLSGGFDSPVASYFINRRGVAQSYIFFYAYPYVGEEVKEKIEMITKQLSRFQLQTDLYFFQFGELQAKIAEICWPEYRTLIFRGFMIKASNMIADSINAQALVTGDSLGQVSSQTIDNIMALDKVSSRSIFRPLLGFTKNEIIDWSKKIGTHDISVLPHDDACGLFSPKHPILRPDLAYLDNVMCNEELDDLLMAQVNKTELLSFSFDGKKVN